MTLAVLGLLWAGLLYPLAPTNEAGAALERHQGNGGVWTACTPVVECFGSAGRDRVGSVNHGFLPFRKGGQEQKCCPSPLMVALSNEYGLKLSLDALDVLVSLLPQAVINRADASGMKLLAVLLQALAQLRVARPNLFRLSHLGSRNSTHLARDNRGKLVLAAGNSLGIRAFAIT